MRVIGHTGRLIRPFDGRTGPGRVAGDGDQLAEIWYRYVVARHGHRA